MQVTTALQTGFSVLLPQLFRDFITLMSPFALNFFQLVPVPCYMRVDKVTKVTTYVLLPISLVVIGAMLNRTLMRGWSIVSSTAFFVLVGCPAACGRCAGPRATGKQASQHRTWSTDNFSHITAPSARTH